MQFVTFEQGILQKYFSSQSYDSIHGYIITFNFAVAKTKFLNTLNIKKTIRRYAYKC